MPHGYSEDPTADPKVSECLHIAHAFERAGEFDVIHNSFDFLPLTYSGLVETPVLTTIHGFSSPRILAVYRRYNASDAYVAISDSDRDPSLDYLATIHHGIDTDAFALHPAPGGYLLFFGRIHPDKGTVEAIEVAARCEIPLVIAGIVQDQQYFDELIAPRIDGDSVSYVGPVGPAERSELLGGAQALLHLIGFDEPFGYSVVEAMACGTPVIAFDRGSMPELIADGQHRLPRRGSRRRGLGGDRVRALDRAAIRAQAVERFGVARMVDAYIDAYETVRRNEIRRAGRGSPQRPPPRALLPLHGRRRDLILAAALRLIQRRVRGGDERFDSGVGRKLRDAEAHRHPCGPTGRARNLDLAHRAAHPLGRAARVCEPRAGQHDGEFLTAVASSEVELSDRACQGLRDCANDVIARLVTVAVVHGLEVVDVRDHERDARPVLAGAPSSTSSRSARPRRFARFVRASVCT